MREIFDEIHNHNPLDATEAARRSMRPHLPSRFYEQVGVAETHGGFAIVLDGKPVRTPARQAFALPSRALADAIAAEWQAQQGRIDPASMPITRLANVVIDGIAPNPQPVAAEIARFVASDLVLYRSPGPERLAAKEAEHWDPVLAWARNALAAPFVLVEGVTFVAQPLEALQATEKAIPQDPWQLGAVHSATTLMGSALIALAMSVGHVNPEAAWAAAHVDEDWNTDFWGRDELAVARREARWQELLAAATVLRTVPGTQV